MYMYSIPPTAELYIDLFLYLKNQHIAISLVAPSRVYLWNQKYPTFSPPQFFSLPFISLYFLILFSVLPSSSLTCGYILGLVNTWTYEYINIIIPIYTIVDLVGIDPGTFDSSSDTLSIGPAWLRIQELLSAWYRFMQLFYIIDKKLLDGIGIEPGTFCSYPQHSIHLATDSSW